MSRIFEGRYEAAKGRFAIVVGRFNSIFSDKLLSGCKDALQRHGVKEDAIDVAHVPGAMEMPITCGRLAQSGEYEAVIALGAVIRGSTPHFEQVAQVVSRGCHEVSLKAGVPVIFGVLTTDNLEQAIERSGSKSGNKGFDAGLAALEMADLFRQIPGGK